jgi:hypothetical protein
LSVAKEVIEMERRKPFHEVLETVVGGSKTKPAGTPECYVEIMADLVAESFLRTPDAAR